VVSYPSGYQNQLDLLSKQRALLETRREKLPPKYYEQRKAELDREKQELGPPPEEPKD
jgi:hypothetical protein